MSKSQIILRIKLVPNLKLDLMSTSQLALYPGKKELSSLT